MVAYAGLIADGDIVRLLDLLQPQVFHGMACGQTAKLRLESVALEPLQCL